MTAHEHRANASRPAPHRRRPRTAADCWAVPAVVGATGGAFSLRRHGQRHVPAGRRHGCAAAVGAGRSQGRSDGAGVAAPPRAPATHGHSGGARGRGARRRLSVAVVGVSVAGGGATPSGGTERARALGQGSGRVRSGDAEHYPAGGAAGPSRRAGQLARRGDPGGDRGTARDPAGGRRLRCRGRCMGGRAADPGLGRAAGVAARRSDAGQLAGRRRQAGLGD